MEIQQRKLRKFEINLKVLKQKLLDDTKFKAIEKKATDDDEDDNLERKQKTIRNATATQTGPKETVPTATTETAAAETAATAPAPAFYTEADRRRH